MRLLHITRKISTRIIQNFSKNCILYTLTCLYRLFLIIFSTKMYLDFLDGYRGSLAYWLFVHHAKILGRMDGEYKHFFMTGYFIGVVGYFLLSSYLLTYRLLDEIKENGGSNKQILLTFIKYFKRRFYRIYVPYVFICILIKYFFFYIAGSILNWYEISFFQWISLNPTELTHLWTIPPEIKYYFFIPVLVLITHKLPKNVAIRMIWIIILVVLVSIIEIFDLFSNKVEGGYYPYAIWPSFLTRFTTFYLGSILAFIMHLIHDMKIYKNNKDKKYFGFTFGTISLLLYLIGMILCSPVYTPKLYDKYLFFVSVYWAIFLFFFILGGGNYFTDFFKSKLFYFGGKFSFGIYMYHMGISLLSRRQ